MSLYSFFHLRTWFTADMVFFGSMAIYCINSYKSRWALLPVPKFALWCVIILSKMLAFLYVICRVAWEVFVQPLFVLQWYIELWLLLIYGHTHKASYEERSWGSNNNVDIKCSFTNNRHLIFRFSSPYVGKRNYVQHRSINCLQNKQC